MGERALWTLLGGGEGMVDSTWWGRGHGGLYLVGERAWWTLLGGGELGHGGLYLVGES